MTIMILVEQVRLHIKATYNDIKGTVVLFDLDNRAANDFE